MRFEQYKSKRDQHVFFESVGTNKGDIRAASKAMQEWVKATYTLLEACKRVPEAFGDLGGNIPTSNSLGEDSLEHQLELEIQRVKYLLRETNLEDLMTRLNQHAARITTASERLL